MLQKRAILWPGAIWAMLAMFSASNTIAAAIGCVVPIPGVSVNEVTISKFDSDDVDEMQINIDGGLIDYFENEDSVNLYFSNECDNYWEFNFPAREFNAAKLGEVAILRGKVTVSEPREGEDDMDESGISSAIECRIFAE